MVSVDDVQAVVERARGGDSGAFGELYERFAPEIRRYLVRQLYGRHEAAEDLTEEVFIKALQHIGSYEGRGLPFAAWLYRIARNHLIDHLRSSKNRAWDSLDDAPDLHAPEAERALANTLDRHELIEALGRLTDDQRQVVSLRFLGEMTTAETARIMGKSEDAVKKLQARALVQMRRIIEHARRIGDTPLAVRPARGPFGERPAALGAA
jgi:RNA polymerase sigma-70 factor, ECF subfamily